MNLCNVGGVRFINYNPDIHHRQSIRLKNYNYSKNGFYYVTICTENREHLFGEIIDGKIKLNTAGEMIEQIYLGLKQEIYDIQLDKYVLMPNHFHGIIIVGADSISAHNENGTNSNRADIESAPTTTLATIIQSFKRSTTIKYIDGVKKGAYPPFNKRIWQRNYYDHIIRNEQDYQRIWEYIDKNQLKWHDDCYY
ncbi:MAG: transposase [Oscillospiraceae bacterium]